MKKLILLFLLISCSSIASAQEVKLTLRFLDTKLKPIKSTKVTLTEVETREELIGKTNANGQVFFHIKSGKLWQFDFLKIKNYPMWRIKMPARGTAQQKRTITYDVQKVKWELTPPVDRSKLDLKIVKSKANAKSKSTKERGALTKIILKRKNKTPLANFPVKLFSKKQATLYEAKTNQEGIAYFLVPAHELYDIEVEGIERFSYIKVHHPLGSYYRTLTFEPMNFEESKNGNLIIQKLPANITPISARHLVTLQFKVKGVGPFANKSVTIKDDRDIAYQAQTNEEGIAKFMLPKGYTYYYTTNTSGILEERLEVIDLKYAFGIGSMKRSVLIDPDITPRESVVKFVLPKTPESFQQFFHGSQLQILNFQNNSVPYYAKSYLCFDDPDQAIGIKTGLLMTSGSVFKAIGPNDLPGASTQNSYYLVDDLPKDLRLKADQVIQPDSEKEENLGYGAYDLCRLEFEVKSSKKQLVFEYVFASEEYPEYLNFDDAFGIFVHKKGESSDTNLAKVEGDNISVSNINHQAHASFYWANDDKNKPSFKNWQYDGFTKKLKTVVDIEPNQVYIIKLMIFDRRDGIYDSGLFINFWAE